MNQLFIQESTKNIHIALCKDKKLFSFWTHDKNHPSLVNSIYMAQITKIQQSLSSIFLELEPHLPAFLFAGDIAEFREKAEEEPHVKIRDIINPSLPLLVQVQKEAIKTKSAKVSTQISLPGIFIVYLPLHEKNFIKFSKKIKDENLKEKLTTWAKSLSLKGSLIFRSSVSNSSDVESDLNMLIENWKVIQKKIDKKKTGNLYHVDPLEARLSSLISYQIESVITNSHSVLDTMSLPKWKKYYSNVEFVKSENLFEKNNLKSDLQKILKPTVWLPSGSCLVIEETEVGTTIDVNTGKQTSSEKNVENFIFKVNREAAIEAVRQIRLRSCGGIIFIDFIDMQNQDNKEKIVSILQKEFEEDNIYTQVYPVSPLGVVEVSRKRTGPSLQAKLSQRCSNCYGRGWVINNFEEALNT